MLNDILNAMLAPFTSTEGWQAFAYGVTGRVILTYARNFIEQYNPKAERAGDETKDDLANEKESE